MAETMVMASARWRPLAGIAALALSLGVARGAGAAPMPVDDPEVVAGIDALRAGDTAHARDILELAAPRLGSACDAARSSLDGDDPRLVSACHTAALASAHLGVARGLAGDGAAAHQAFAHAVAVEPEVLPAAAVTPPKIRRIFEAARQAALGHDHASEPGTIAGLEHRPPLVAVRGESVPLDLRAGGEWRNAGTVDVVYAIDRLDRGVTRAPMHRDRALYSAEIPAGALLGAQIVHYRLDAVDGAGRVHKSRWYPLHVLDSLSELPKHALPALADEIDGPALEAAKRLGVTTDLAAATALPSSASTAAARPESPDSSVARDVAAAIFR